MYAQAVVQFHDHVQRAQLLVVYGDWNQKNDVYTGGGINKSFSNILFLGPHVA